MRRSWRNGLCSVIFMVLSGSACLYAADQSAPGAPAVKQVKPQTLCPVLGNKIDKKLFVDYEGKRIYVCCPMCIDKVKKDPAKYVKHSR